MRHHRPNPRRFARRTAARGVVAFLCLALTSGCKTNNRYDLIEAELRTREQELANARAALDQSRNLLRAYEASQSRGGAGPAGSGPFLPVKNVEIGRGTGGVDEDGAPGDEGLMVVVVPRDEDGSAVKVPGRALVAAWEITPAGLKHPIGSWDISSDALRRTWKSGFISTGYFVALPWQTPPSTDRLRVAVRLVTTDGRAYEADRDVNVRPPIPLPPNNNVLPYPTSPIPGAPPGVPTVPPAPPGSGNRQPLLPEVPPPGVPSAVPPGTEELPPPAPVSRGARLLTPVKQ
jgi:hypothetical protein